MRTPPRAHRDGHRRGRPGRLGHRVPPPAGGPAVRHPRRRSPRRGRLAAAVGQPAAVLSGAGGRPARHALPRAAVVVPHQGRVRGLPESYAAHLRPPGRPARGSTRLPADSGFTVTAGGHEIDGDNVVLCTGTFGRTPHVPGFADQLDPSIRQLHSSEYRRPLSCPTDPFSSSARLTPAATSPTSSPRRIGRCCAARTPDRSPSPSTRRCSRWSSPPCSSCSGTC